MTTSSAAAADIHRLARVRGTSKQVTDYVIPLAMLDAFEPLCDPRTGEEIASLALKPEGTATCLDRAISSEFSSPNTLYRPLNLFSGTYDYLLVYNHGGCSDISRTSFGSAPVLWPVTVLARELKRTDDLRAKETTILLARAKALCVSERIDQTAIDVATAIIETLNPGIPLPQVSTSSDAEIGLSWFKNEDRFEATIWPDYHLVWVAMINGEVVRGQDVDGRAAQGRRDFAKDLNKFYDVDRPVSL